MHAACCLGQSGKAMAVACALANKFMMHLICHELLCGAQTWL